MIFIWAKRDFFKHSPAIDLRATGYLIPKVLNKLFQLLISTHHSTRGMLVLLRLWGRHWKSLQKVFAEILWRCGYGRTATRVYQANPRVYGKMFFRHLLITAYVTNVLGRIIWQLSGHFLVLCTFLSKPHLPHFIRVKPYSRFY